MQHNMDQMKNKKPLHEGIDAPGVLLFGRGYGETPGIGSVDATTRFNQMATMSDPYSGGINPVMARVANFSRQNAPRYSVDPNPELDEFVDTLFVTDMGPEAFTLNGENPYRLLEKIQSGEDVSEMMQTPSAVQEIHRLPAQNEPEAIDDSFLDFASMFGEAPRPKK